MELLLHRLTIFQYSETVDYLKINRSLWHTYSSGFTIRSWPLLHKTYGAMVDYDDGDEDGDEDGKEEGNDNKNATSGSGSNGTIFGPVTTPCYI